MNPATALTRYDVSVGDAKATFAMLSYPIGKVREITLNTGVKYGSEWSMRGRS